MIYLLPRKILSIIHTDDKELLNYTIIMRGQKILSIESCDNQGHSSTYISRRVGTSKYFTTRHSEIKALHNLRKLLQKKRKINSIKVINFRLVKDHMGNIHIGNSQCCRPCCETLYRLGINTIIYSTNNGDFVKESTSDIMEKTKYSKGSKLLFNKYNM